MKNLKMDQDQFDALLEYSTSLPTGKGIGKQWKRREPPFGDPCRWLMGEYVGCDEPGMVGIEWSEVEVLTPREAQVRAALCSIKISPDPERHSPECKFRIALTCSTPIECDHGFDVCPTCDPCTCVKLPRP